ncbi:MAG: DNA-processing protein DprA [Clostridia bacterium]|nr:DNA-processing protein DprA [Clostridia bacterium]
MVHTDDAYAAMLLTMALSPNKEEYARPLSVQEFRRFEAAARASSYKSIGRLMEMDISGLMIYLGLSEEEGYRVYTLMHRGVQLTYAMEGFAAQGIEVVTQYDEAYPERLERKLGQNAPPCFYLCGDAKLLGGPAVAIAGIGGVRTTDEARRDLAALVGGAIERGYGIITGGEPGVARVTAAMAAEQGGRLLEILGGDMCERLKDDALAQMIAEGRAAVLSQEHPDALFTVNHAIVRNRALFSLADAAFIFSTDGRRGEVDAIQNHTCDWVYAWKGFPGNGQLIARGAVPFGQLDGAKLDEMSRHWSSSGGEQLSFFDML